jgi:hypothetical protein
MAPLYYGRRKSGNGAVARRLGQTQRRGAERKT